MSKRRVTPSDLLYRLAPDEPPADPPVRPDEVLTNAQQVVVDKLLERELILVRALTGRTMTVEELRRRAKERR